jgi:antitoxin component YwqK of YwqJK toxin-antitoxin module
MNCRVEVQGELRREFWDNVLAIEVTLKDGKRHGTRRIYHDNGQVAWIQTYENGKEVGEWIHQTPEGKIDRVCVRS